MAQPQDREDRLNELARVLAEGARLVVKLRVEKAMPPDQPAEKAPANSRSESR